MQEPDLISSSEFSLFYEHTYVMLKDSMRRKNVTQFMSPIKTVNVMMNIDFTILIETQGRIWHNFNPALRFKWSIIDIPATITKTLVQWFGLRTCYFRVYEYYSMSHNWRELSYRFGYQGLCTKEIRDRFALLCENLKMLV